MKNKLLFSVFVYFIILTLLSLGFWQIYRLNWKLELIEQIENSLKNDPVELSNIEKKNYLRINTSGDIDFDKQIYLYNLNDSGKPGFEVINPIKIGDINYLLNRGWIPFEKKDLPEINLVDQNQIVGTLMLQTKASSFKPENDIENNYWSARVRGKCVICIDTINEKILEKIDLPTNTPTCVTFGGAELSSLYVTSLRADPDNDRAGGNIHKIETSTKGREQLLSDI